MVWSFTTFFINKIFFWSKTRSWWVIRHSKAIAVSTFRCEQDAGGSKLLRNVGPKLQTNGIISEKNFDLKLAQTYSRRCTPYRLSETAYSIYSQPQDAPCTVTLVYIPAVAILERERAGLRGGTCELQAAGLYVRARESAALATPLSSPRETSQ